MIIYAYGKRCDHMRRYIALTAVVLAFTGCGKTEQVEQPTQTEPTQVQTEITTEDVPVQVKPDVADIRTYCVSLDAARNAILADYKDKIPEKLRTTFDANSDVLRARISPKQALSPIHIIPVEIRHVADIMLRRDGHHLSCRRISLLPSSEQSHRQADRETFGRLSGL